MIPGEPSERHRSIAATFTDVVACVPDWGAPTPVEEWRAIDVVGHLLEWPVGFLAAGGVQLPSAVGDPGERWAHHTAAIQALLDGPRRDDRFTHPMVGTFPLAVALDTFYTSDVFMHTWDLARASGHAVTLDADEAQRLLDGMAPIEAVLRRSGHYGERVPVADGASASDRLMAFIGRDPSWRPSA